MSLLSSSTKGETSEYLATIVLDCTVDIFIKNKECARINYREWPGILKFSSTKQPLTIEIDNKKGKPKSPSNN